jgi:hypothetical protein
MDDAQHIPTSAQHGAKHTMPNVALTQKMSVSDTTTVAGKFRALYMAMVQSKPSNDSTHTPPSSNRGHKLLLHAYTLIFSALRAEYTNNLQQDPRVSPGTESLFPHITASQICWHHTGATSYLGKPIHQYFQRHTRTTQQCTTRLSRTTKGQPESTFPHITAPPRE